MKQLDLILEDLNDALKTLVQALGGVQEVGTTLRPSKTRDSARTWLSNALNPDRDQKLELEDIVYLLTEGRRRGIHIAMGYLCKECGYHEPTPNDPVDEKAELQKQFIRAKDDMGRILRRMEDL